MSEKKKVLLIDANNMFFRAYAANPSLNINGQHVGAIIGFFYSLQKCIKDTRPHKVVVIWDGKGGSKKRQEIRPDYKHGRKPPKPLRLNRALDIERTDEEEKNSSLYQQGRIIGLLNSLPILQLCEPGVEADDFIAYMNNFYSCEEHLKIIVSNDKDFIQLLDNCTLLYRPTTKEFVSHKAALSEYGIHPVNMALARAIAGDNSDNLDGVPRVGLATVAKLLPEFASDEAIAFEKLESLCEALKLTQKVNKKERKSLPPAEAILEHIDKVKNNYKIMQLYMPMVPAVAKLMVDEQVSNFKMEINMDQFLADMKEDGIFGVAFTEIVRHCKNMIRETQK